MWCRTPLLTGRSDARTIHRLVKSHEAVCAAVGVDRASDEGHRLLSTCGQMHECAGHKQQESGGPLVLRHGDRWGAAEEDRVLSGTKAGQWIVAGPDRRPYDNELLRYRVGVMPQLSFAVVDRRERIDAQGLACIEREQFRLLEKPAERNEGRIIAGFENRLAVFCQRL